MKEVKLSRNAVAGTVALYWDNPGFPENVYIALETSLGFGESHGGFAVGSVVDAVTDLEGGYFFEMARIDELVLNIPERNDVEAQAPTSREKARTFWASYPWQFADRVNGIKIRWE